MTFRTENDNLICSFPQRLDTAICAQIEPEILSRLENLEKGVFFDLNQVEFVSSSFLRLCLVVFKKVGEDRFSIINVSPWVKKVFKIAGFDQGMKIE